MTNPVEPGSPPPDPVAVRFDDPLGQAGPPPLPPAPQGPAWAAAASSVDAAATPPERARTPAVRLRELAGSIADADDVRRLRDLADATEGGPSLAAWVANPPAQVINTDQIVDDLVGDSGPRRMRWLDLLEGARNILILAPVLVTWYGISEAVSAYYDLLSAVPARAEQTFLYLWQSGFDGRLDWLTLGRLAFIDSLLIGLVLFLTTMVTVGHHRAGHAEDVERQRLQREVRSVLTDAGLALAQIRITNTGDAIQTFDTIASRLLKDIAQERERITDLAKTYDRREKDIASVIGTVQTTVKDMAGGLTSLNTALPQLEKATTALHQSTVKINALEDQLATAMRELQQSLTDVLAAQQTQLRLLAEAVNQMTGVAQVIVGEGNEMRTTATTLATGQHELISAMAGERDAQAQLATLVSKVLVRLDNSLKAISQASNMMHGLAVDTGDLARATPRLVREVNEQLTHAAQQQRAAAVALLHAATALDGGRAPAGVNHNAAPFHDYSDGSGDAGQGTGPGGRL